MRKNVSGQYCVCSVYSGVDQMIVVLLVLQKGSPCSPCDDAAWWEGKEQCGVWLYVCQKCVHDFCTYRVPLCNTPLRLLQLILQLLWMDSGLTSMTENVCFFIRREEPGVAALHAFVGEIKSVAIRWTPQQGNGLHLCKEGFTWSWSNESKFKQWQSMSWPSGDFRRVTFVVLVTWWQFG